MNILYIHAHDAGRYISPYGHPMPTPNLMRLAKKSTLFRHAYTVAPTCSPSRAAMLTGMTAHESGMFGLAHRGFSLKDPDKHLAHYLREQGYTTALCGVQHEFGHGSEMPYDETVYATGLADQASRDHSHAVSAANWIHKQARQGEDKKPFFLSCGFYLPHRDFPDPDDDFNPDYLQPPSPLPDTAECRRDMAAYMTAVRYMDRCVGIVIDALRDSGLEEETIVFFTVDHGIAFPWMKCNLYDTGMGVSFMIRYPGNPTAGKATDALVSQIDVFPTLCDLAGVPQPGWLSGKSLKPVLEDVSARVNDAVFGEVTYHAVYEPMRAIRTERYKLIRSFEGAENWLPTNCDDSWSKTVAMEAGMSKIPREAVQLFDLHLDPNERRNLAEEPSYADVLAELSQRLEDWMKRTNDPLLEGPIPAPPGAKVNRRDSISPRDATITVGETPAEELVGSGPSSESNGESWR